MIVFAINALSLGLTPLAGPYRVLAYKFRSFGGIGSGLLTWFGIVFVYGWCRMRWFRLFEPEPLAVPLFAAMVVMGWVQMFAKWCSSREPRDPAESHCWFGRGEPVFALALSGAAEYGASMGRYYLAGYLCSSLQIGLARLRGRLEAWTPEDTERLAGWARAGAAPLKALAPRKTEAVAPGATVRRTTFAGRVMSHVVAHFVIAGITGTLGIWGIVKFLGLILVIPAWLILWATGGDPGGLPGFAKEDVRSGLERMREAVGETKEELGERLETGKERLKERFEDGKERVSEEVESRKRQALWNFFTR